MKPIRLGGAVLTMAWAALFAQPVAAQDVLQGMAACRMDIAAFCRGLDAGGGKRMACLQQNRDKLSPACATTVQSRLDARAATSGKGPVMAQAPVQAQGQAQTTRPAPGSVPGSAPGSVPASVPGAPSPSAPSLPQAASAPPSTSPLVGPLAGPPSAAAAERGPKTNPMRDCRQDVAALCGAVAPARGAKMACLRQNTERLSPACAQGLAAAAASRQDVRAANKQACQADVRRFCRGQKGADRQACLVQYQPQLSPACAIQVTQRLQRQAPATAPPADLPLPPQALPPPTPAPPAAPKN